VELFFDEEDTHFDASEALESDNRELDNSFKQIDLLNGLSSLERQKAILTEISGTPIHYSLTTAILGLMLAILSGILIVLCVCKKKNRRQHPQPEQESEKVERAICELINRESQAMRSLRYKPRNYQPHLYRLAPPPLK